MKFKKIEVRYYTRTGNTQKLAEHIAKSTGCEAKTIDFPILEKTDILFIGASIYGASIDKNIKDFIASLEPEKSAHRIIEEN